jgi:sugar diacid utilization regulator
MRDLHEQMLSAVMAGDGLEAVAELAAHEVGGPVAILLPGHGLSAVWPEAEVDSLLDWTESAIAGAHGELPSGVEVALPIPAGDRDVGRVIALTGDGDASRLVDREEVLRMAALTAVTELAVAEARDQLAEELRGSLIEELRAGAISPAETLRRGRRLGADLSAGAIAMAAEATGGKPRYMAAIITSVAPDAVAEPIGDRVLALLGVSEEVGGAESAASRAREIIRRLRPHGPAAASSVHSDPAEAGRALEEAELMLDVVTRDPRLAERFAEGIPTGVYRLLFRALASNPAEVVRFYEDTVAPLVEHDRDYRTDLLNTLEAYLDCDCNMRATAEAVYAHRHTVAHRLDRIRELTGLDPSSGEDRERLGLGIKAYRLIEPTLPR